jgi:hypothetical protein
MRLSDLIQTLKNCEEDTGITTNVQVVIEHEGEVLPLTDVVVHIRRQSGFVDGDNSFTDASVVLEFG